MASATDSKLATAIPPRFLISSTTSSAGAALLPAPPAGAPGSLTTNLAPSLAQSNAISRPMPPPAPVTMMTLSCSDLAIVVLLRERVEATLRFYHSSFEARRIRLAPQDHDGGCCATVTP